MITACRRLEHAKALSSKYERATPMSLDVFNEVELDQAVSKHDLVISLIPYTHHPTVIKSGLKYKKNIVTTSYVSDATRAFDDE